MSREPARLVRDQAKCGYSIKEDPDARDGKGKELYGTGMAKATQFPHSVVPDSQLCQEGDKWGVDGMA